MQNKVFLIGRRTRADAIAAGELVDLSARFAAVVREAGFKVPFAMTRSAYDRAVAGGDEQARVFEVLAQAQLALMLFGSRSTILDRRFFFTVTVKGDTLTEVRLHLLVQLGEAGEVVATILLADEDQTAGWASV